MVTAAHLTLRHPILKMDTAIPIESLGVFFALISAATLQSYGAGRREMHWAESMTGIFTAGVICHSFFPGSANT